MGRRLKLKRFRVRPPLPDALARTLRAYDGGELYARPETLTPITAQTLFGREGPLVLDLGCGRGEFLVRQAARRPDERFAGLDWHLKSLWYAVHLVQRAALDNVRLIKADFRLALALVPDQSVSEVTLLFPPPILRHNRLSADPLPQWVLPQVHRVLIPGGRFHFVTDAPAYFEVKRALVEAHGGFEVEEESQGFEGGQTWYQQYWERLDYESYRVVWQRRG